LGLHARRNLAYRLVDVAATQRANAVISVSADTTRRLITMGVPSRIIHHIPNGLSAEDLGRLRSGRRSRGESGAPLQIGFVGRLSREKGLKDFVRLAQILCERDADEPRVRFSVLGGGDLSPALGRDSQQLRACGQFRFLGEVDDVPNQLAQMDLLVMPSHNEGLPYALLEAMAAGLAVVAYGVGGIPEVIDNRSLGRLVRPRDFRALVSTVEELVAHPQMIREIGQRASDLVVERYSLDSRRQRLLDAYEQAAYGTSGSVM
jgi:glycosyltransferase involved in cell wall biosynthesis